MNKAKKKAQRAQVASVMRWAASILGTENALAAHLKVPEANIWAWIRGQAPCPNAAFEEAAAVLIEHMDREAAKAEGR